MIGKRMAYLRRKHDLSQEQLGADLAFSSSHIGNLENGRHPLTDELRTALGKRFQVDGDYFQEVPPNPVLNFETERLISLVLMEEKAPQLFENPSLISVEQELALQLLRVAYLYKQRRYEEGDRIRDEYLAIFLPNVAAPERGYTLQKCLYLYEYEMNYKENDYGACERTAGLLLQIVEDDVQRVKALQLLAASLFRQRNYSQAFLIVNGALESAKELKEKSVLDSIYLLQAGLFIHLKFYGEALKWLGKVEDSEARLYRGKIYRSDGRIEEAISVYEEALREATRPGLMVKALTSLVGCHLGMGDLERAESCLGRLEQQPLRRYDEWVIRSFRCELMLYRGQIREHRLELKKVVRFFSEHGLVHDLEQVYGYLSRWHYGRGDYREAANYFVALEALR